ncbi:OLC1v1013427C1 [Oldenlandia corymbosa var. corymbosa]|uniref:OLC1v1013427C1 n=1 Tax=Oldenlandia corymbosa var. corymbosa TaxID=529605 RepID=A0AAV1E1W7_OLDCO|nr:OLC1v1013427C1 [Oldenlandia corymbosa var. corymbosa]
MEDLTTVLCILEPRATLQKASPSEIIASNYGSIPASETSYDPVYGLDSEDEFTERDPVYIVALVVFFSTRMNLIKIPFPASIPRSCRAPASIMRRFCPLFPDKGPPCFAFISGDGKLVVAVNHPRASGGLPQNVIGLNPHMIATVSGEIDGSEQLLKDLKAKCLEYEREKDRRIKIVEASHLRIDILSSRPEVGLIAGWDQESDAAEHYRADGMGVLIKGNRFASGSRFDIAYLDLNEYEGYRVWDSRTVEKLIIFQAYKSRKGRTKAPHVRDSEGKAVLDFVSTIDLVDKVESLRSKYDFPSALEARAPLGNERGNSPPRGRITVYDRFMHLGLRFPLYPLFEEIVQPYRTPLARFTPNLITFVLGFARVCQHDWYIVKRRLRTGVKKMVEAYGGSLEWKPDFVFVKAPASYCLPWNLRETEGLGAIKDEWTQEDEECVEEFQADMEKILKYSKVVKWNDVPYYVPLHMRRKVIQSSSREQPEFLSKSLLKKIKKTVLEAGPSIVPPVAEKGKGPLEGEAIVLPPQLFEGGPSVAIHTFSNPPSIECPILKEFAAQLNEADSLRLVNLATARAERDEALFEVVTLEEKARQVQAKEAEIVEVQAKYDELDEKMKSFASLHISKEELHQWCTAFMYKMMSTGGMAAALEEMNLVATKCGAHRVGVAGLKRLDQGRPIKAKWFKQLLMKDPKKTMHEAMVKVLIRLSLEQLPLWGAFVPVPYPK